MLGEQLLQIHRGSADFVVGGSELALVLPEALQLEILAKQFLDRLPGRLEVLLVASP